MAGLAAETSTQTLQYAGFIVDNFGDPWSKTGPPPLLPIYFQMTLAATPMNRSLQVAKAIDSSNS